LTVGGM